MFGCGRTNQVRFVSLSLQLSFIREKSRETHQQMTGCWDKHTFKRGREMKKEPEMKDQRKCICEKGGEVVRERERA